MVNKTKQKQKLCGYQIKERGPSHLIQKQMKILSTKGFSEEYVICSHHSCSQFFFDKKKITYKNFEQRKIIPTF